jgi:hypothetical protein
VPVVVVLLIAGVALAVLLTGKSPGASQASGTASPSKTAFTGDLRTLLLTAPAAATPTRGPGMTADGALNTVDDAAATYGNPDAAVQVLRSFGFQRGAIRQWVESDGEWVGISLYQFRLATNATDFAGVRTSEYSGMGIFKPAVPIAGVPGGVVYQRSEISVNNRWLTEIVLVKGTIVAEIFVTGPLQLGPERPSAIAKAQYDRLP